MTHNPYLRAVFAAIYIIGVVLVMDTVTSITGPEDNLLIPMTILSLFVLSASVMGYLFLYVPLQLYFDNKRQEGLVFFGKTVGAFALMFVLFLAALLVSSYW